MEQMNTFDKVFRRFIIRILQIINKGGNQKIANDFFEGYACVFDVCTKIDT